MDGRLPRRASRLIFSRVLIETLETRQLLSAAVYHPDFVQLSQHTGVHPMAVSSPSRTLPAAMRQAYGVNNISINGIVGDGTGQTIAIVDAFHAPTLAADLATFDALYGLPAANLTMIRQDGSLITASNQPPVDNVDAAGDSWAVETALDVEWAHVIAPGAKILVVLANNAGTGLNTAVTTAAHYAGVSVVSLSWGGSDLSGRTDSIYNVPKVTFVASSGDDGAYTSSGASYPASSPYVLAVGGTTLYADAAGNYSSESAWSGSGGGLSTVEAEPAYQKTIVPSSITTAKRALPDVSWVGDPRSGVPVIDSYDFGNTTPVTIGGTSLAAPMWAGLLAITNQERVAAGQPVLNTNAATNTMSLIYGLPSADFHDITAGSNGHQAAAGFDLATGRGTPRAQLVVAGLVGNQPAVPSPQINSLTISTSTIAQGAATAVTLTANATDTTAATITGVKFYTASGTLLGSGALGANNNWTFTIPNSAALAAGTYGYYAVATDSASVSSPSGAAAIQTSLTVTPPAPTNDSFANAFVITGSSAVVTGSNVNATKQTGEPTIAGQPGGHSVWFTWTAPVSGKFTLTTGGSNFDTLLGVYKGTAVNALTLVTSNDDVSNGVITTSTVTFTATAGVTYRFVVDGWSGATGNYQLNLAQFNDNFANAITLGAKPVTWIGTNTGATRETGEPSPASVTSSASIWFNWTAAASGSVTINTAGSGIDTVLGVYRGTAVNGLTLVAANDDAVPNLDLTSSVTFSAVAGTTYRIVIAGWNGAKGAIQLNIS